MIAYGSSTPIASAVWQYLLPILCAVPLAGSATRVLDGLFNGVAPMKNIPITRGLITIVDNVDYEYLIQWRWHAIVKCGTAYAARWQRGATDRHKVWLHRDIMSVLPEFEVDHINHDTLDNRRCNLRICTRAENSQNRRSCHTASGYRGVYYRPRSKTKPWFASIQPNGRAVQLGYHRTAREAAIAYNHAARKHFGAFASLNPIPREHNHA